MKDNANNDEFWDKLQNGSLEDKYAFLAGMTFGAINAKAEEKQTPEYDNLAVAFKQMQDSFIKAGFSRQEALDIVTSLAAKIIDKSKL